MILAIFLLVVHMIGTIFNFAVGKPTPAAHVISAVIVALDISAIMMLVERL